MPTATPYHHGNLRAELLAAAESVVREEGAEALSLRALARDLGVSHAAPGKHFSDRRALLDALAVEGFVRLGAGFASILERPALSARDRLREVALSYLHFAAANPGLLSLMFECKAVPDASSAVIDAGRRPMELTVDLIAEGQLTGEIQPGDARRMATLAFAAVHGIAALSSAGFVDGQPVEDLATDAVSLLWN